MTASRIHPDSLVHMHYTPDIGNSAVLPSVGSGELRMNRSNEPTRDPNRPATSRSTSSGNAPAGNVSPTPAGPATRRAKRVLIVEDERDLSELIALNLQRNGYEVRCAFNGADAVTLAKNELPDMVVLDIMLPGIDGNEVTRQLRADSRTANLPIIMLTAKSEETDVVVGLKLGADDYVTKPFSMKILLARIESLTRRVEQSTTPTDGGRLKAGPLEIDPNRHEVYVDGNNVQAHPDRVQAAQCLGERPRPRPEPRPAHGQGNGHRRLRDRPRDRRARDRDPEETRRRALARPHRSRGRVSTAREQRRRGVNERISP